MNTPCRALALYLVCGAAFATFLYWADNLHGDPTDPERRLEPFIFWLWPLALLDFIWCYLFPQPDDTP